ncbi:PfkB family carbohydrate kinase [Methyloligella solikamskensis]|uniref:Phosphofructokinase n=1 Tax=Methyloligella solikamskensis TaxID=1177756 RepID=A0ABW3J5B8_9HYPH
MRDICVLAPWPIFTVTIERGMEGSDEIYFHAGGQGFWVARMIANLGSRPILCGPLGGESGVVVRALVEAEGIELRPIRTERWNGGYVHDRRCGERKTVATMPPGALNRHETDDLYDTVLTAGIHSGVVVMTGVIEEDILIADFYKRLALDLSHNGVAVVADLSKEALLALDGGVTFLKVSHSELIGAGFCEKEDEESVTQGLLALKEATGATNAIVSRADQPALALLEDRLVRVTPPRFEALDHRGAGDSMTAALAVAEARELPPDEALRMAAAAGALNVTRHGLGTGKLEHIQEIAAHVLVEDLQ